MMTNICVVYLMAELASLLPRVECSMLRSVAGEAGAGVMLCDVTATP